MSNDDFLEELARHLSERIEEPAPSCFFRDDQGRLCMTTETDWGNGMRSGTVFIVPEKSDDEG